MALMLAPYNSAMRLGMGFNSYTQALCVNDVVRKPGNVTATEGDLRAAQLTARADAANEQTKKLTAGVSPQHVLEGAQGRVTRTIVDGQKEVSQVVSWEATFVENSSDILSKLDVSGALSIKMAGLGSLSGKAGFVDSSEIKKADINYLIHVRVTNQRLIADNMTVFAPIDHIEPGQFTDIYGDCFISGFIEGGEFDAIVSITTENTMKKNGISGELELSANISGVDVAGSVKGAKDENSTLKGAKTKISVTWSGGGDIRPDTVKDWTLQNLKEVAMSFPDAVAACPQRVSAILTKYTALRSYHEQTRKGSPLDYENAGVYTAALYDAYTDYKLMWKEIQAMMSVVNRRERELYVQTRTPRMKKYAEDLAKTQADKQKNYDDYIKERTANQTAVVPISNQSQALKPIEAPLPCNSVEPYTPDVFGLEDAAKDCRFEMIKIVREVDAVTSDPKVACDPQRTSQYLSPSVFKLLLPSPDKEQLPTMKQWTDKTGELEQATKTLQEKETEIAEIKKKLEAVLITPVGDLNESLLAKAVKDPAKLHPSIETSLAKLSKKADEYRMQSLLEKKDTISTGATFFNDLEDLQPGARPTELRIWTDDKKITGICVVYTLATEISHGQKEGEPQHVLTLKPDEVITEVEVHVVQGAENKLSVTAIAVATSKCDILTAGTKPGGKTLSFSMADHRQWSFRGFFGFTFTDGFEDLGIVWGKDTPTAATSTIQLPPARNLLKMSPSLQEKAKKSMSVTKPTEHFYMGDCVSIGSSSTSPKTFSAVDGIAGTSRISKIGFCVSASRLCGLRVEYDDGKNVEHGAYSKDKDPWICEVKSPIVAAKLTVGKTSNHTEPFVDTVELVCGEEDGSLPLWPLDVLTIRYLGDHTEADQLEVVSTVKEQAPKLGRANWTLRGFYGEESEGLITRLGLIWGCA